MQLLAANDHTKHVPKNVKISESQNNQLQDYAQKTLAVVRAETNFQNG